jgi:hypothetical protein
VAVNNALYRSRPLALALALCCAGACLGACASRKLASVPPQPTVVEQQSTGWTRVSQPGWFNVLMPHAPEHGELRTTSPQGGELVMKRLSASSGDADLAIAYAELVDFDDHDAMLAEVRLSFENQGAKASRTQDVVVQGRDGVEGFFELPAGCKLNPDGPDARARVRVLLDQSRAYVLLGIEPASSSSPSLVRFFDSFEFAPLQPAPSAPASSPPAAHSAS